MQKTSSLHESQLADCNKRTEEWRLTVTLNCLRISWGAWSWFAGC